VNISFECVSSIGTYRRADSANLPNLRVESIVATVHKSLTGQVQVPPTVHLLVFNRRGTLIVRPPSPGKAIVLPPRTLAIAKAGTRVAVHAARGEHELSLLTWLAAMTPLLDHWITHRANQRANAGQNRNVGAKPMDPHFTQAVERFAVARNASPDAAEPMLLSVAYEVATRLLSGGDELQLANLPNDLPDIFRELTQEVRKQPNRPWPLKEAADFAGYSPFHFSRVFKQMVGFGFHEFVDRCRTQMAIESLCSGDQPIDVVASSCGFGTTQGLRDSIKEYLGLVPSELRATIEADLR
jgi:AraC-like DNA-binding protein